jgi:dienelactone hydrolase
LLIDSYTPLGRYTNIGGLNSYISDRQPRTANPRALLVLLPDGFGLAKHNMILADEFAKEGYRVIIPDYFEG